MINAMQEQRKTVRLRRYWDALRVDGYIPPFTQFDATNSEIADIWPYCFHVEAVAEPKFTCRVNYMGTELINLYGTDLTGQVLQHETHDFPGTVINHKLEGVYRSRIAQQHEGTIFADKKLLKYRACLLPFGKKSLTTDIVVCLSYAYFQR